MRISVALFALTAAVCAGLAGNRLKIHSNDNHFVYLADAFLRGHVELQRKPHHQNDWASYDEQKLRGASAKKHGAAVRGFFTRRRGKPNTFRRLDGTEIEIPRRDRGASERHYFVSFPPAPAVLMMPMVAISGYGANDVIFTVFFAGLNAALIFLLLRRFSADGHSERSPAENVWLSILLVLGTAHLWCAVLGQVWFTALVVGLTFNLLYIYFAVDARRPLLAGICLAIGFATRTPLLFASVFFYLQLFLPAGGRRPRADLIRRFALFSAPCLVVGVSLLVYNQMRFGDPLEFGHTYLANGTLPRIRDWGLFHPVFLGRNLSAALTLVPRITGDSPYLHLSKHGMSLLITTPALIWILWPRRRHPVARALGITAACIAVPIFFYQNTGWEQFGYRFSLDFMPYLVGCIAIGGHPITRWFKGLIIAGVLVNAFGAATFKRGGVAAKLYGDFIAEEPRR